MMDSARELASSYNEFYVEMVLSKDGSSVIYLFTNRTQGTQGTRGTRGTQGTQEGSVVFACAIHRPSGSSITRDILYIKTSRRTSRTKFVQSLVFVELSRKFRFVKIFFVETLANKIVRWSGHCCIFAPTIEEESDDAIVTVDPLTAIKQRLFRDIPAIIGVTKDEGLMKSIGKFQRI